MMKTRMQTKEPQASFLEWRESVNRANAFGCEPIKFSESSHWAFRRGVLRHSTGGFFSLAGLRAESRDERLNDVERLIILQPETAINGFITRRGAGTGTEVLFQGRVEPGNVGGMQLAPTVQSTEANIRRLHGGNAPPLVEYFIQPRVEHVQFDELQSEEASRYYGKYNRNVALDVPVGVEIEHPDHFRWLGCDALRSLVGSDNILNTDARSVLSCMSWRHLAYPEPPFGAAEPGTFGHAVRESFRLPRVRWKLSNEKLLAHLMKLRVRCAIRHTVVPIHQLGNWNVYPDRIAEITPRLNYVARQFRVRALGREVGEWDQPLIESHSAGRLTLVCQQRDGALHFLLQCSHEIGYLEGVQFSTSIAIPPGESVEGAGEMEKRLIDLAGDSDRSTTHLSCRQSEEGGRFYLDENDYSLVELDPAVSLPDDEDYVWVPLAQIRRLRHIPGALSMELRGALTMLLHYL